MSHGKRSRRDFLKATGITAGAVAGVGLRSFPAHASALDAPSSQAVETLTNYGSHTTDGRTVTVVSATGQHLKITAYGGYIGWATWAAATVSAALPAGRMVKIRATATGSSGSNLDRLTIS